MTRPLFLSSDEATAKHIEATFARILIGADEDLLAWVGANDDLDDWLGTSEG